MDAGMDARHALLALAALLMVPTMMPATAAAGGLGDYKDQKHGSDRSDDSRSRHHGDRHDDREDREIRNVRPRRDSHSRRNRRDRRGESCRQRVYRDCRATCNGNQSMCARHCQERAGERCGSHFDRSRRRHESHHDSSRRETRVEVRHSSHTHSSSCRHRRAGSSHSSSSHSRSSRTSSEGSSQQVYADEAFEMEWDAFSAHFEGGLGAVGEGVYGSTGHLRVRYKNFGAAGTVTHLADGETWMSEWDFGPAFFVGFGGLTLGVQPSMMLSGGEGVDPLIGGGVRGYARLMFDRLFVDFDPMLGRINGQWNYHLRTGAGWRFTPNFHAKLAYDQRNIIDLDDGVDHVPLRGAFLMVGARWN